MYELSGWKKEPVDARDYKFRLSIPLKTTIPDKVDLSPYCTKIEDQGNLGSCTGQAIVGVLEYFYRKKRKTSADLSRLFVYYNERMIEGTVNEDSGAYIRDGIKSIAQYGVCNEKTWPYDITKFTKTPSKTAYKTALSKRITVYQRLNNKTDMLNCLASGAPFVFGFLVFDNIYDVGTDGILSLPTGNNILGGHAVCAVGYDLNTQMFKVRNSWGENWADKGYFYMPFDYVCNSNYADDFWTLTV